MFKWFDGREAAAFGVVLADFFAERVPVKRVGSGDRKSLRKFDSVIERIHLRATEFRRGHPLNLYKRAKLMNAFQWRLLELGYDRAMVEELARSLVRSL